MGISKCFEAIKRRSGSAFKGNIQEVTPITLALFVENS